MLKTVLFAVVAMTMLTFTAGVKAEDDLLSEETPRRAAALRGAQLIEQPRLLCPSENRAGRIRQHRCIR